MSFDRQMASQKFLQRLPCRWTPFRSSRRLCALNVWATAVVDAAVLAFSDLDHTAGVYDFLHGGQAGLLDRQQGGGF